MFTLDLSDNECCLTNENLKQNKKLGFCIIYNDTLKNMLTFLWEFLYDIMILKSLSVHHLCQNIIKIFSMWSLEYQFYFSSKDSP